MERYRTGQDVVVRVNKFVTDQVDDVDILKVDPRIREASARSAQEVEREPQPGRGRRRLDDLRVAEGDGNLLSPIEEPLRAGGSIGEVCGAMRDVFGEYPGARSSRRRASGAGAAACRPRSLRR